MFGEILDGISGKIAKWTLEDILKHSSKKSHGEYLEELLQQSSRIQKFQKKIPGGILLETLKRLPMESSKENSAWRSPKSY